VSSGRKPQRRDASPLGQDARDTIRAATRDGSGPSDPWNELRLADRKVLVRHHQVWERKPALERVYSVWFDALLEPLAKGSRVLEVGAGPAFLSAHARRTRPDLRWIASDLLSSPDNDLVADAVRLPLGDATVDALVGFDVIHHLVKPGDFLREAARVLKAGGRVLLIEPWITSFSYPIYHWIHHEQCLPNIDPWQPFAADYSGGKQAFEGNSAVPWKLLRSATASDWQELGLGPPEVRLFNGFTYLLTLGFYGPSLLPRALIAPLLRLDRLTQPVAKLLAIRARIVWPRLDR
jgi:SAM-dependent methyltransferase